MGTTTRQITIGRWPPVHPHVRGDDTAHALGDGRTLGSPPRAWGRLVHAQSPLGDVRFTPTCVGTTLPSRSIFHALPVHPHVRGDDPFLVVRGLACCGSPPRAWGRRIPAGDSPPPIRFTPTCVGTTRTGGRIFRGKTVHPHVRGDDKKTTRSRGLCDGSPPRAWGRRRAGPGPGAWRRFTPTCVGTTRSDHRGALAIPVHPHVRGDDLTIRSASSSDLGSPPRAWGRRERLGAFALVTRFTPTCVGTTSCCLAQSQGATVHPHVRGDDPGPKETIGPVCGSPPRAWGRLRIRPTRPTTFRFTPTCVGTTFSGRPRAARVSVHPHVRGDDPGSGSRYVAQSGSPPRAWGRR